MHITTTIHYTDLPRVPTRLLHQALAQHGRDCPAEHADAVAAYAGLLSDLHGPYDLLNDANRVIRPATRQEVIDSAATPEGWIDVDGARCYVCP